MMITLITCIRVHNKNLFLLKQVLQNCNCLTSKAMNQESLIFMVDNTSLILNDKAIILKNHNFTEEIAYNYVDIINEF